MPSLPKPFFIGRTLRVLAGLYDPHQGRVWSGFLRDPSFPEEVSYSEDDHHRTRGTAHSNPCLCSVPP